LLAVFIKKTVVQIDELSLKHAHWALLMNFNFNFNNDKEPGPSWGKQLPGERPRETAET
jgi:hypothetical protein